MNDILFGNNNKAVIKKLANRSFRSNKMRNVIAVIAIALTTFLFTSVLTIGLGAKGTMEYSQKKLLGTQADTVIQFMTEEQFEKLKSDSMFESVGCWRPVQRMTNTNRLPVEIDYADSTMQELRFIIPHTGSAPKAANEVLVTANVLKDLEIEEKVGAKLPVEFKVDGQEYHFDMVVSGIYDTSRDGVGFVIVSDAFVSEYSEIFNTFPEDRNGGGAYTADAIMKDTEMAKERVGELVRNIGGNPDDVNADNFVRVSTYMDFSDDSNMFVVLATIVFGILFMFCGYLLIYNVFEIAVTNDIRQYGLLRTVGTTSKQVKCLVNWQALYLFLIGTPVGLLVGLLVGRGVLPAAIEVFAFDYGARNIEVGSLPYLAIVIISILFSGITVFISTRKSVKKASRVSPIEAVRYVEHEHFSVKRKTSHRGSVISRMATANTTRNKRRTCLLYTSPSPRD